MASFLGLEYITPYTPILERTVDSELTLDRSRSIVAYPGTNWRFTITLERAKREKVAELAVHRAKFFGQGSFSIEIPQLLGVNIPSQAVNVRGGQAAGSSRLNISSRANAGVGVYFNIAGDPTLYQIFALEGSLPSATYEIVPPLRRNAANGARLNFNPTARVRYHPSGSVSVTVGDHNEARISLDLEEVKARA